MNAPLSRNQRRKALIRQQHEERSRELNTTLQLTALRGALTLSPELLRAWLSGLATPDMRPLPDLTEPAHSINLLQRLWRHLSAKPAQLLSSQDWYHTAQSVQALSSSLPITPGPLTPSQWPTFAVSCVAVQVCLKQLALLQDQEAQGQPASANDLRQLGMGARLIGTGEYLAGWLGAFGAPPGAQAILSALADPYEHAPLLTSLCALPGDGEIGLRGAKYALGRLPRSKISPGLILALIGHQSAERTGHPETLDWRNLNIRAVMDGQASVEETLAVRDMIARSRRRPVGSPERHEALQNLRAVPAPEQPGHPGRALLLLAALRLTPQREASALKSAWSVSVLSDADQADALAARTLALAVPDLLERSVLSAITGEA